MDVRTAKTGPRAAAVLICLLAGVSLTAQRQFWVQDPGGADPQALPAVAHGMTDEAPTYAYGKADEASAWIVEAKDQKLFAYTRSGNRLEVAFDLSSTSLRGAGNELRLRLPGGLRAASQHHVGQLVIHGADNVGGFRQPHASPRRNRAADRRVGP